MIVIAGCSLMSSPLVEPKKLASVTKIKCTYYSPSYADSYSYDIELSSSAITYVLHDANTESPKTQHYALSNSEFKETLELFQKHNIKNESKEARITPTGCSSSKLQLITNERIIYEDSETCNDWSKAVDLSPVKERLQSIFDDMN